MIDLLICRYEKPVKSLFLILKWQLRPVGLSYFQSMNIYSVNYIENTHSVIDNSVVYMRIACWPWLFVPSSTVRCGSISWISGGGLAGFSELNIKLNILSRYSIQSYFRIVLFSPFHTCKLFRPVFDSPRHDLLLANIIK